MGEREGGEQSSINFVCFTVKYCVSKLFCQSILANTPLFTCTVNSIYINESK